MDYTISQLQNQLRIKYASLFRARQKIYALQKKIDFLFSGSESIDEMELVTNPEEISKLSSLIFSDLDKYKEQEKTAEIKIHDLLVEFAKMQRQMI